MADDEDYDAGDMDDADYNDDDDQMEEEPDLENHDDDQPIQLIEVCQPCF